MPKIKIDKTPSPASERGKKQKNARAQVVAQLEALRGKDISKLNSNQQGALLLALCQLLGLAGDDGRLI
jgi:hypothetical protein